MERFTISLDDQLAAEFDTWIAEHGYGNRSEAVRDLLRAQLERTRQEQGASQHCIASLSYVYNHHERDLAERLTALHHDHHELTVSTMHAHLDHDACMETSILRGPTEQVRALADILRAQRGVHHGQLNLVSLQPAPGHDHGHAHPAPRRARKG